MKQFGFTKPVPMQVYADIDLTSPVVEGVVVHLSEPGEIPNGACPFQTTDPETQRIAEILWQHYAETWL